MCPWCFAEAAWPLVFESEQLGACRDAVLSFRADVCNTDDSVGSSFAAVTACTACGLITCSGYGTCCRPAPINSEALCADAAADSVAAMNLDNGVSNDSEVPAKLNNAAAPSQGPSADGSSAAAPSSAPGEAAGSSAEQAPAPAAAATAAASTSAAPEATADDDWDDDIDDEAQKQVYEALAKEDSRSHMNVVFIGHVDAGKSTLGGQILCLMGGVDDRTIEKYQKEARDNNRETWYMAYVMDTNDEERAKGKTVEVGRAHFATPSRRCAAFGLSWRCSAACLPCSCLISGCMCLLQGCCLCMLAELQILQFYQDNNLALISALTPAQQLMHSRRQAQLRACSRSAQVHHPRRPWPQELCAQHDPGRVAGRRRRPRHICPKR